MQDFKGEEQLPSFGERFPVVWYFCWRSNAQDLVSIWAFAFTCKKDATHLWPLCALNSALFHLVTQQSHWLFQSQMLCCLAECCTWTRHQITSPGIAVSVTWFDAWKAEVGCLGVAFVLTANICTRPCLLHKYTFTHPHLHTHTVLFYSATSIASGMFSVPPSHNYFGDQG